jgi:CHAD domain-containing protein
MREQEVKLLVEPGQEIRPDTLFDGLGRVQMDEFVQDAVYFDTTDLRLTRAGASLRYRSDDGWTVKLPESSGTTTVRDELQFPGSDATEPPHEAVSFVSALSRSAPLQPVARLRTHRRRFRLRDRHDQPVGELDDDTVRGTPHGSSPVQFHEVEFEVAAEADPKVVAKIHKRLQALGATDDQRSKVSRVLGSPADAPPDLPRAPHLDRRSTLEDLARAVLADGTHRLVTADPVVRAGDDDEGVHQARVATRRLRSDLRTLRPVLDTDWSEPLRSELQWLGELLGRVRDADVLAPALARHADTLRPGHHARAGGLLRQLGEERSRDRTALLEAMNSPRYLALLDRLVDAARSPRLGTSPDPAAMRLGRGAARLIDKPWKRLRKACRNLPRDPADRDLHEIRKRAKQARYAIEAFAPALGKQATRAAKALAELQDSLGDHQDAVAAISWIERTARETRDFDTVFVAGGLAESFAAERRRLRAEWRHRWKHAKREYQARPW